MKKRHIILCILLCSIAYLSAQPKCHIEHYGIADGLPERTIMDIFQDKKGFMWFATWDGLCKFDGYNFTTYKTSQEDSIFMKNNRIDKICEDIYGYIWVHTYGRETFRFDPKKEKYIAQFQLDNSPFSTSKILTMPSGKVWLTSENMGAICIPDTTNLYQSFNSENNTLKSNHVYNVYEDSNKNSWILTGNGIVRITPENESSIYLANNQDRINAFYCAYETDREIWFGTNNGRIWCFNKKENRFNAFDTEVNSNIILIQKIYDNLLIILSSKDGFLISDETKTTLRKYNKSVIKELPTNEMISCFVDKNRNIWFEMNYPGTARYNILEDKLVYYNFFDSNEDTAPFGPYFFIVEDKSERIWVHPNGGKFSFYDKNSDRFLPFYNNIYSPDYKFSDKLHDIFVDKQGNLWFSTRSGGIEKVVFDNEMFRYDDFNTAKLSSINDEIRSIFEDKEKNIWLASKDGLIVIYDRNKKLKGYLCTDGSISLTKKPLKAMAYTIIQDREGNIWIGSKGNGVYILEPENNSYSIKQYQHNPSDIYSLSENRVYTIHEDTNGQIWVGTYGRGINLYDKTNKRFISHLSGLNNYPVEIGLQVRSINSNKDKIYVGTTLGLIVFNSKSESTDQINYQTYTKKYKDLNSLRANDIYDIFITRDDDIFIATFGGGLSKITKFDSAGFPLDFKTYDTTNGLYSDIVLSITEDNNKNIWINSEGNLTRFNIKKETFEQFNDLNRVLDKQFFSEAKPLLTSDGEIIMGTTKGTITFLPEIVSRSNFNPYLALIKFNVSNKRFPLNKHIDELNEIYLNHNENIFSIEFATLDFTDPKGIIYSYKLEGIDKEWILNYNQRVVNYTKLPPGDYVFKVKSSNSDGRWVENERSLHIKIKPAFWQTNLAYTIYVILFFLVLFIILRSIFIFYRMRDRVILEQEQTEMKTRFFTDISHEIRTPLTMIVSPIEGIIDNEKTHSDIKPQLQLILRNANRMLKMVNQILDFRKIQKQKLHVKEIAFGDFITNICNSLMKNCETQGISLEINRKIENEKIWMDEDAIEKLIFNLVSNSMKHTERGKRIMVNIFNKDRSTIALQIKDEGRGMNKEVLNKLFTRFASFSTDKSKPSTGIGLSIVKEVVDRHHARILVESDLNKGSAFTILFQTGMDMFINDNNVEIIYDEEEVISSESHVDENEIDLPSENTKLSILVVEDDNDLREFIKSILTPYYNVLEATNGNEGYAATIKYMPDFILSDIMMPEMNGTEFLKKIRENHDTSHIPLIFLTAKTNIDDHLEGITLGANDYITKPFNIKLLIAKINNIIEQRKLFSTHLNSTQYSEPPSEDKEKINDTYKITSQDELFLKNLYEILNENLENSDLSIDDLAKQSRLGRRVFFNKIKSLTGLPPIELLRKTRIDKAAELLKNPDYKIKEVSYMVGFTDSKYFTLCFKDSYGVTPTEYRNQFLNNEFN